MRTLDHNLLVVATVRIEIFVGFCGPRKLINNSIMLLNVFPTWYHVLN